VTYRSRTRLTSCVFSDCFNLSDNSAFSTSSFPFRTFNLIATATRIETAVETIQNTLNQKAVKRECKQQRIDLLDRERQNVLDFIIWDIIGYLLRA